MDKNVKNKLSEIISGLDTDKNGLKDLLDSEKGRDLINSLSETEKKEIINKFMSLGTDKIKEGLKNADRSSFENLTADEIKKKLR